ERTFFVIEFLRSAGREGLRRAIGEVENPHERVRLRFQDLPDRREVSAAIEFLIECDAKGLKTRTGNRSGHRFGNQTAERLIEPGDLRRFEPDAVVEENATQRTRINR